MPEILFPIFENILPNRTMAWSFLRFPLWQLLFYILNLLESFLKREELVKQIPGKLAIVEAGQIRIRTK